MSSERHSAIRRTGRRLSSGASDRTSEGATVVATPSLLTSAVELLKKQSRAIRFCAIPPAVPGATLA